MPPIKDLLNPSTKIPVKDLLNPEPAQAGSSTDPDTTGVQAEVQGKKCVECPNPAEKDKLKCRPCLDWQNEQGKERREKCKKENKCQRCPEPFDGDSGSLCKRCCKKKKEYDASRRAVQKRLENESKS